MKPFHVIKIGGALVDSAQSLSELASAVSQMTDEYAVVIVHGGGPQATRMARQLGHVPEIVDGRRITTAIDLEIIQATVCGMVNSKLISSLTSVGLDAVGLSGASAAIVQVHKRPTWTIRGKEIDFGFVGDIDSIDPTVLHSLAAEGYTPVLASLGIDSVGQIYNVNADTTAAALAVALNADEFSIVTDSGGLRHNGELLESCDEALFDTGKLEGWIDGGMLVKLTTGFQASARGVSTVRIVGPDGLATSSGTRLVESQTTVVAS